MIQYLHSSRLEISIADSLQILQAAMNSNIKRAGQIMSRNSGFVDDSFEPSVAASESSVSSKWSVSIKPGSVFLPNGEVISYSGNALKLPITHFGTQFVIVSKETTRMTDGVYAQQIAPSDTTVYVTSKTVIRTVLGGTVPQLNSNELLICKIVYPINGSPTVQDLRNQYSTYWSLPYSVPSSMTPGASIEALQSINLRPDSISASTINNKSIAHKDDPFTIIKFSFNTAPCDICNARIERVKGASFVWDDILYDCTPNPSGYYISDNDFALTSDTYRISFTDAFDENLSTQWSDFIELSSSSGAPAVNVSTIDAVARVKVARGSITAQNCTCVIWASENTITNEDAPLWIGPLSNATGEYNAGAMLSLQSTASTVRYKVAIVGQNGKVISVTSGSSAVSPEWPKAKKMCIINLQADMTDSDTSGTFFSTDMVLQGNISKYHPVACYYNPSSSSTIITEIAFDPSFDAETTSVAGVMYARKNFATSRTRLFDVGTSVPASRYEWPNTSGSDPFIVGPGEYLSFEFDGGPNRSQGHIYIYGYSL